MLNLLSDWRMIPLGIGLSLVCYIVAAYFVAHSRLRRRINSREELSFDDWYARYYGLHAASHREQVMKILEHLGSALGVRPTCLRPSDRVDQELSLGQALMDDRDILCDALEEYVYATKRRHFVADPSWVTLSDFVTGCVEQSLVRPR
jgi:hypothetical protein